MTTRMLAAALIAGLAAACASTPEREAKDRKAEAAEAKAVEPTPEIAEVLRQAQGYASWPKFPENREPELSEGHGGVWVVAYHNDAVGRAMREATLPLPDGSIIVKENRPSPEAEPAALTVMAKQAGSWTWVKATPAWQVALDDRGRPVAGTGEGAAASCESCHAQARGNDYVFTHDFSQPLAPMPAGG